MLMEDIKEELVEANELKEMEFNPRKISKEEMEKLKNSIKEFGVVSPIVINKDGTIISGHQRFQAMKELGYTLFPVKRLNLTYDKAKSLNLAMNKIQGEFDDNLLNKFISGLDNDNLLLAGFNEKELVSLGLDLTDLEMQLNDLETDEMNIVTWECRFKKVEWDKISPIIQQLKKKYGFPAFYSSTANGKALTLLCNELCEKCEQEQDCNAQMLKKSLQEWNKKQSNARKVYKQDSINVIRKKRGNK